MEPSMILISGGYRKLNRQLHQAPRGFGASGHRWTRAVARVIRESNICSLLDYGCGQSTFWSAFRADYPRLAAKVNYREYDPAIPGKKALPTGKHDLVTCTDVLEHVEPDLLNNVIEHVFSLASVYVFFNVAICPANKHLPDGRNAHLIVKSGEWWSRRILNVITDGWGVKCTKTKRWKDVNIWATAKAQTATRC